MARKGATYCELTLGKVWESLPPLISLDDEVQKMIQEGIISDMEVSEIKNKEGHHDKIVEDILYEIQKKGSGAMHILLDILKNSDNVEILKVVDSKLDWNITNCSCETSTFSEAQVFKSDTEKRDQGSISSLEFANMADQISKLMERTQNEELLQKKVTTLEKNMEKLSEERTQNVELLEKKVTTLEKNMEKLSEEVTDLKINLGVSKRENEMLKAENIRLKNEIAKQNDIHATLMDAKEAEIKTLEKDFLENTESEQESKILQEEIKRLKDELAMLNDTYKKAIDVQENEKIKLEKDWQGKYTVLQDCMQNVKNTNAEKQERLKDLTKEIISLRKAYQDILLEKTKADSIIMAQGKQIKEDETKHLINEAEFQNKLDELKRQLEHKEKMLIENGGREFLLEKTNTEAKMLTNKTHIKETEMKYLQDETANQKEPIKLRRTYSELERDLESCKMENEDLKNQNQKLTEDLGKLQTANRVLPFTSTVRADHRLPTKQRALIPNRLQQPQARRGRSNAK